MKRACFIFLLCELLFLCTILAGCAFRDIDKRFFVVAMGIDKSNDEKRPYDVTLKLAIPSPEIRPGKANFQIISEKADSIPEAVRVMKSKVDKEFDFGHCRMVVFDEKTIRKNQGFTINWFLRRRDIQGITYLGIGKPSARDVLKARVQSERLPGNALILSFDPTTNTSPYIMTSMLNDFYMRVREDGIDPYLPIIEPIKGSYNISKVALFAKGTLKADLTRDETRILNELMSTDRRGQINVASGGNQLFVNVDDLKSGIQVMLPKGEKPYIDVHLDIKGFIEGSGEKLATDQELKRYEKIAGATISKRVKRVLKTIQKMEADPLGLGLRYQAKMGATEQQTKDWERIYPNMDIRVHTDLKIKGTGTMY
ncbi:Ger(x)C family spore germination protein [Peribacillus glennii]|uniref:Ger(X)C family spore germination protein n=1 Tax=Peribacillus glennii TaxID=2303991 RepID=A0A372LCJ7_9BACI|nr:Ger(x)C family spore germination protein [Peribacillus glennii]RFU63712.1 Ger(x)C family spore germination protein [Peribacillus glennii]